MTLEDKFKIGAVFKSIVPNMETHKGETKYYKIVSIRRSKEPIFHIETNILGFKVKEMKFEKVSSSVMAVDVELKETKIQDTYKLKETNDKPKYLKFTYRCLNQILTEEEQTKYVDRV